jgi:hypothetical protein
MCACLLTGEVARADESSSSPPSPAPTLVPLSPDARRFLVLSGFSYWAGTERVSDGELSIAPPRPSQGAGFLPALDDHLSTTTYLRAVAVPARGAPSANLFELASLHDVHGGAVLGIDFRFDARDQSAVEGGATLALPLPAGYWFVPSFALGEGASFAPQLQASAELRSDRSKPFGYSVGAEGSTWSERRARVLVTGAVVAHVAKRVALEGRIAAGAWSGVDPSGLLTLRSTFAAVQELGLRSALYQRVTLAHGPTPNIGSSGGEAAESSVDLAFGVRHAFGKAYGFALQLDEGAQQRAYTRAGVELTLYGVLF